MIAHEAVIIRTGAANLASVQAAMSRLGVPVRISDDPDDVRAARLAVLPGVGAFGPAARRLRTLGLDAALTDRVRAGAPLLAVCLGLQLLCEASEESPGTPGLGLVPGVVRRFETRSLRVPHMGWNAVAPAGDPTLLEPAAMYFAHSFRLPLLPDGWAGASADYGGPFVAVLERGPLLACQFHPELSGSAGLALLRRWLARAAATEPAPC